MKVLLCVTLAMLVAPSVASNQRGPRCYDGCSLVKKISIGGETYTNEISKLKWEKVHSYEKCTTDFIKYCKAGETCNSLEGQVTGKVADPRGLGSRMSTDPQEGTMEIQHTHCGPSDEDKTEFCDMVKMQVMADLAKTSALPGPEFTATEVSTTCDKPIEYCDGKAKECVNIADHPDWKEPPTEPAKDPHEQESHGDVPKICALLLAYPFLAFMN